MYNNIIYIVITSIVSKYTNGPQPFKYFMKGYVVRLFASLSFVIILNILPESLENKSLWKYYLLILPFFVLHRMSCNVMFVSKVFLNIFIRWHFLLKYLILVLVEHI